MLKHLKDDVQHNTEIRSSLKWYYYYIITSDRERDTKKEKKTEREMERERERERDGEGKREREREGEREIEGICMEEVLLGAVRGRGAEACLRPPALLLLTQTTNKQRTRRYKRD